FCGLKTHTQLVFYEFIIYNKFMFRLAAAFLFSIQSQVVPPIEPKVPEISDYSAVRSGVPVSGRIIISDGKSAEGIIYFPSASLNLYVIKDGINYKSRVEISNLSSMEIIRWKKSADKNGFIFYPAEYNIIISNKSFTVLHTIKELWKLTLINETGTAVFFSYFYDYLEKGVWKNSGHKEADYPERHPHKKTVKKIILF
ncbi:MAG TPA: hypothetical protein DC049_07605, partial [Spirochaetia bacterium]|nr:hypothetical protein [Spirochaetia bacterium]